MIKTGYFLKYETGKAVKKVKVVFIWASVKLG